MKSQVTISLTDSQKDLKIDKVYIKHVAKKVLTFLNIETNELSLHFVSGKKICSLHKTFFNDPSFTDCITFPIDPPSKQHESSPHVLGEIFICPKAAIEYASAHSKDPQEELLRYVIHGILHLAGYDDLTPLEKKRMRAKENSLLKKLHSPSA